MGVTTHEAVAVGTGRDEGGLLDAVLDDEGLPNEVVVELRRKLVSKKPERRKGEERTVSARMTVRMSGCGSAPRRSKVLSNCWRKMG